MTAIIFPSGDHRGFDNALSPSAGRLATTCGEDPSSCAMSSAAFLSLGDPRTNAIDLPSGENVGSVSASDTLRFGVPPSEGTSYKELYCGLSLSTMQNHR